jgi:hypothetical protein
VKLGFTALAGTATLYSAFLGTRIAKHADEGAQGVTEPGASTSKELAGVQRQQKVLQWTLPLLTGVLVVLAAQQGEQQRPAAGFVKRTVDSVLHR